MMGNMRKLLLSVIIFITGNYRATAQEILTLPEALAKAFEHNYGIRLVRYQAELAQMQNTAGNAGMLPSVSADITAGSQLNNSEQSYVSGDTRSVTNASASSLDAGVFLNWTLFDGFKMFATKDRLEALEQMGEMQVRAQMESTALELMSDWYQCVLAIKFFQYAEENMHWSESRYAIVQAMKNAGTAAEADMLQALVDLHADSVQWMQSGGVIRDLRYSINQLMGRDPAIIFLVQDSVIVKEIASFNTWMDLALEKNSVLQLAQKNAVVAGLQKKEMRAGLFPAVSLNGGYNFLQSQSESGFVSSNLTYGPSLGLTLSIPLFNGMQTRSAIQQMDVIQNMQNTAVEETQLNIRTEILKAYDSFNTSRTVMELERSNVEAARKNVVIALERFAAGTITSIDLRWIQLQESAAVNRLLTATLQAKLAELTLQYYAGGLGEGN